MSKYDEPEPIDHWWDESPAGDNDAAREYQDQVTSELEANIDEFLEFKSFRSLIKLIAERA